MIGIITYINQQSGGSYQYTLSLVETLTKFCKEYDYLLLKNSSFPSNLTNYSIDLSKGTTLFTKVKMLSSIILKKSISDFSKIFKTNNFPEMKLIISPMVSLIPLVLNKPYIVTIHDFQHKYLPEMFSLKDRIERGYIYRTAAKNARIILCESKHVRDDIIKFLQVSPENIRVIESPPPHYISHFKNKVQKKLSVIKKYSLPEKFMYYPAQFWKHKNHSNLLRAIVLLKKKYRKSMNLVFTGSQQNNFDKVMKEINNLSLQNQVYYLGFVPEEDIPYIYSRSACLVMPSLFESVSMPVWEAFYLGVPVVCSNVCALPEQVGNAGLLFDPYDPTSISKKINQLLSDQSLQKELVIKGYQRIKNLTQKNYAIKLNRIIKKII
jgi:glycosyltransferase involved in cell wall biosynthesis